MPLPRAAVSRVLATAALLAAAVARLSLAAAPELKGPTAPDADAPPEAHHVRCTVILQTRPDRLYCYASNAPFRVILKEPAKFGHGEVFLADGQLMVTNMVESVPTLIDATVQRLGETNLPAPLKVTPAELSTGRLNFHRVVIHGRVTSHEWMYFMNRHIEIVVAEGDGRPFRINVLNFSDARRRLPVGTEVEFVGLSFLEVFAQPRGPEVQMDVENLDECTVLRAAPWFTLEIARRLVIAAIAVGFLGTLWLVRERRQIARLIDAQHAVRQLNGELEQRIQARTVELSDANTRLQGEVAARKQAEADLRVALANERELNELKSRFVSMVSHEFRTPLAVIMSSAEILEAYLDRLPPAERATNLRDIIEATRDMGVMVDEVLLLSRIEAGRMPCKPSPLDLADFCHRVADEIASATHRRCPIRCHLPPDLASAWADEGVLRHIFTNLLVNAAKYSPPGSPVDFTLAVSGEDAVFTVSDHGIGIPEADLRQLFTAFQRGRNVGEIPGSGLGLVIVKSCVDLHHGRISFKSREAEGTTFVVSLPLFRVPVGEIAGQAAAPVPEAALSGRES